MALENICNRDDCTGCSLCMAICPVSCITMREGKLGHLYPVVDMGKCIDCGLCAKRCPANLYGTGPAQGRTKEAEEMFRMPDMAYAAWAKNEKEYITSTSGGAAAVLSEYFISAGGTVYGCAACPGEEKDGKHIPFTVKHVRIDSREGLYRLKGSKYVQSSIGDTIPLLKKDVRSGRPVLFTGTPCQVAAVRQLFPRNPENLFLMDIVCHGVPPASLLGRYVRDFLGIRPESVSGISFRESGKFIFRVKGDREYSHRPLSGLRTEDLYYNLFMDGFTYRESCYRCPFATIERISDITAGDFWHLGDDVPAHPHGVSLILPVSEKGRSIIPVLEKGMNLYVRTVQEAASGNGQLRSPWHKSLRIKLFRALEPFFGLRIYYPLVLDIIIRKRFFRRKG